MKKILGGIFGGLAGGTAGAIFIRLIVLYVGEPLQKNSVQPVFIIFWGVLLGVGVTAVASFLNAEKKSSWFLEIISGTLGAIIIGSLGGKIISGTFTGGGILSGITGFWVVMSVLFSDVLIGSKSGIKNFFYLTFTVIISGAFAGGIAGLLWGVLAEGAHAEGYVLLVIAMISILSMMWGIGIIAGMYFFSKHAKVGIQGGTLILIVLLVSLTGIETIGEFRNKQNGEKKGKSDNFPSTLPNPDKSTVIKILQNSPNKGVSELTALYLLTGDTRYAFEIKAHLLKEARGKKFTNPAHSVKSKQLDAAERAISYLEVGNIEGLFCQEEKEELIDWFKDIVERVFTVEWVDYLYAFAFRRAPVGPYENQEIGVGALSVFAQIIEDKYPEIAQKCRTYIDEHAVVWGENFRNTDDSIGYHSWWMYSAFLVAKYRPRSEWLKNEYARESFEWILAQWPPNGMTLGYNDYRSANLADTMALGALLFQDGRYKWLASKMLQRLTLEKGVRFPPFYFGLAFWDDSLVPVRPSVASLYLQGPGELPHNPGPSMPDKIVFREGWQEESLYALLNLRYSGWHKYKASNSFITIIYGKPFVVEDFISKKHTWLPAGRSLYRDKKIDRIRLNGFQVGLEGYERLIYDMLQIGSPWAQDPPQYADVEYFQTSTHVDFSKTSLPQWRGWSSERVSVFVKNSYLAVFDRAEREKNGTVAVSWHLKGSSEIGQEFIQLKQDEYHMNVYYPHKQDWYEVKIENSLEQDPPAGEIHAPDIDVYFLSEGKPRVGWITLFIPQREQKHSIVKCLHVEDVNGLPGYPNALGITVIGEQRQDTLGIAFLNNSYSYGTAKTDSELFVLQEERNSWCIAYKHGSFFERDSSKKPVKLLMNTQVLKENVDWRYDDGTLIINFPEKSGEIRVNYL